MPSTYAHKVFGELVSQAYPQGWKRVVQEQPELFQIGLHGPDILFYYRALRKNRVNAVGFGQHEKPAREFFEPAAALVRRSGPETRAKQQAYLLGFLCHFALDHACHGYIERKIQASGVTHTEIEVEFDRCLMVRRGLDPLRHRTTDHIVPSLENSQVIAPFFPGVTVEEVRGSLRAMIRNSRLLLAPGRLKRGLILGVLRLTGNDGEMRGLVVNRQPNPLCEDSNLRLEKLMRRAAGECLQLTEAFMPCLERELPLPPVLEQTFGPGDGWQEIPVLPAEEEQRYEV